MAAYRVTFAVFLMAGALIRCYRVGDQIILDDEWHALNVVQNTGYAFIFSHLGHADHSIPLALLYEWFSHTIGLSEITMRLPSLVAGIALILLFPLLMRPWLRRHETLMAATLLAISPFLINFSRVARPYSLLAFLTACSLPLAWRWWNEHRWGFGFAWFLFAVLAAWLNPASLAISLAPVLWFGVEAMVAGVTKKNWRPLLRLTGFAVVVVISLAALFYVPVSTDFVSLEIKSGMDKTDPGTWVVLLGLFSGSGRDVVVAFMTVASLAGLVILGMRDRGFGLYLPLMALVAGIAVSMTGAQYINYGLVPARYLIGLLPVYLVLIAIALAEVAAWLQRWMKLPEASVYGFILLVAAILILAGPLRSWDLAHSQFVHHLANQFDYKTERNAILEAQAALEIEPFYAEIAQLHPWHDAVIVEAPWYLESNFNMLNRSQRVHGQRVRIGFVGGLCAGRLYGELRTDVSGFEFRNFTRLTDLLAGRESADYLILRRPGGNGARPIEMDYEVCEHAFRERFGPPWRGSDNAEVFKLNPTG